MSRKRTARSIVLLTVAIGGMSRECAGASAPMPLRAFVEKYCVDCHRGASAEADLPLDEMSEQSVEGRTQAWEKVVRKLLARQMPPADSPRPDEPAYEAILAELVSELDSIAERMPRPGRTDSFRRLTRTEYKNAIRDLLALDVDVASLLPKDESSHGFDNVTVGNLSPTLLERYMTTAQVISRRAVGSRPSVPNTETVRIPPDVTQEDHVLGLPLGTRGGTAFSYNFPRDGEYEVQLRLARDRDEYVEGLAEPHEVELLLDRERVTLFTVEPPSDGDDHHSVDAHLTIRFHVTAGPHQLGATFPDHGFSLLETKRQPYQAHFNRHRHPRRTPAIYQVTLTGPFSDGGPGDTPSRRRVFICRPNGPDQEEECAQRILATLMRRAWRRPIVDSDLRRPMEFFRQARADADFDTGIETALAAVLVNPQFLFRVERDPPDVPERTAYLVSPLELASRLSFFIWGSLPDDELLEVAECGALRRPEVLEAQVHRMLADSRADALVTNFAAQWLQLRNLDAIRPDMRQFPDFDDNLRQSFRRETELLFQSVLREDRSVLDLLQTDHTFLNERLAKHYGIPHVYGSRFRRVPLDKASQRGGLLRQGSVLALTSYATRTSPVIRGKWILDNLLGMPPPPPPPEVPALEDNTVSSSLSVRQRLIEHRAHSACARCHDSIDPLGFCLEHYDAVGRWRSHELGEPIDATGSLPDGRSLDGVRELEREISNRADLFVGTMAAKLLTFALGRGIEHDDAPAIRRIVREARANDYRFSSLLMSVARSVPFQMRTSE